MPWPHHRVQQPSSQRSSGQETWTRRSGGACHRRSHRRSCTSMWRMGSSSVPACTSSLPRRGPMASHCGSGGATIFGSTAAKVAGGASGVRTCGWDTSPGAPASLPRLRCTGAGCLIYARHLGSGGPAAHSRRTRTFPWWLSESPSSCRRGASLTGIQAVPMRLRCRRRPRTAAGHRTPRRPTVGGWPVAALPAGSQSSRGSSKGCLRTRMRRSR
mmetsp:Transcript_8994/g.25033  ORF Transcript_8994/g.25033 Transcript_8994/m.25033 type:complete len:215 (-) Transcript_8994:603-1247(-)